MREGLPLLIDECMCFLVEWACVRWIEREEKAATEKQIGWPKKRVDDRGWRER